MLVVPGGTPAPVVDRLNAELRKILALPAVKDQFSAQGLEPTPSSPEEARAYLRTEVDKWAKVIKASGARPD
jgi:tripartite-type tricarboxylate transporter receptor subunit TctC